MIGRSPRWGRDVEAQRSRVVDHRVRPERFALHPTLSDAARGVLAERLGLARAQHLGHPNRGWPPLAGLDDFRSSASQVSASAFVVKAVGPACRVRPGPW